MSTRERMWRAVSCGVLLALAACNGGPPAVEAVLEGPAPEGRLYLDVHHLGPGQVRVEDVADAHQKDLAVQGSYDVDYQRYWVDEESGTIFCLVEAPDADRASQVHREAHGLVADEVLPVEPGILPAAATGEGRLFLDTHVVEPGADLAADVAEAHRKDLAVQGRFGVRFLEYWVSPETGRVHCLVEAPDREAVVATHRAAHGLVPDELREVEPGR